MRNWRHVLTISLIFAPQCSVHAGVYVRRPFKSSPRLRFNCGIVQLCRSVEAMGERMAFQTGIMAAARAANTEMAAAARTIPGATSTPPTKGRVAPGGEG